MTEPPDPSDDAVSEVVPIFGGARRAPAEDEDSTESFRAVPRYVTATADESLGAVTAESEPFRMPQRHAHADFDESADPASSGPEYFGEAPVPVPGSAHPVEPVDAAPPPDLSASAESFRVRCPDCGPQIIPISDVRYVETGDGASANRYVFACPECGVRVRRPAGPEISEILRSSGVATLALHRGSGEAG